MNKLQVLVWCYDKVAQNSGFRRPPLTSALVQVSRTPGTTREFGHGVAGVREAPRHEIAGGLPGLWGFDRGGDDGGARVARLW